MKFSGRFKSRLEANVGTGGCVSPQPTENLWAKTYILLGMPTPAGSKKQVNDGRSRCG